VETMANVALILAHGPAWFRELGTAESPGTIVCTITGAVNRPGVGEVAMGTTLRDAIDRIGGGLPAGRRVAAVLSGVSNAPIGVDQLDTPLAYESMATAGTGLGSAGFIVIDDESDLLAVAAGAARFLAIESCGQCTHCKLDGLEIAERLAGMVGGHDGEGDGARIAALLDTVAEGARCSLATQQRVVVSGLLAALDGQLDRRRPDAARELYLISELDDIDGDGAHLDQRFPDKQPDWTYGRVRSGRTPVDRFTDHRSEASEPLR
jgi:NADH:ubiquinone oxidoreductase subunit F (NADH-binding)